MLKKILTDRLVSIEEYEDKLKKDSKKLTRYKKSEEEQLSRRSVELKNSIEEVLVFIDTYKKELKQLLEQDTVTIEAYNKTVASYDMKFFEVLKFIQKKEDDFKTQQLKRRDTL